MITSPELLLVHLLWLVFGTVHEWLMYGSPRRLLSQLHSSHQDHWFAISPGVMLHTQVSLFTTRYSIFCVLRSAIVVESHCVAPGSKSAWIKYSAGVVLSTSTVILWIAAYKYAGGVAACVSSASRSSPLVRYAGGFIKPWLGRQMALNRGA